VRHRGGESYLKANSDLSAAVKKLEHRSTEKISLAELGEDSGGAAWEKQRLNFRDFCWTGIFGCQSRFPPSDGSPITLD